MVADKNQLLLSIDITVPRNDVDLYSQLDPASTVIQLRKQFEQIRQNELERLFNRLNLDERERSLISTMSHRLVNKILYEPALKIKQEAAEGNGAACTAVIRRLFALDHTV